MKTFNFRKIELGRAKTPTEAPPLLFSKQIGITKVSIIIFEKNSFIFLRLFWAYSILVTAEVLTMVRVVQL